MNRCFDVRELQNRLGISRSAAYALATSSTFFPAFRVGKRVLISEDAFGIWLDRQTVRKEAQS